MLSHAFGAAFDNPDLHRRRGRRRRRGGDRAARGLVEGHQLPQPRARRRGAADPAPQRLQDQRPDRARPRQRRRRRAPACRATATRSTSSRATIPPRVHQAFAADARPLLRAHPRDPARGPRSTASSSGRAGRRSCCARRRAGPGPKEVDGVPVEGTFRAHQVPLARRARATPSTSRMLEDWMRSYRPGASSSTPTAGSSRAGRARAARATGAWAPTRTPTAASCCVDARPARLPRLRDRRSRARRRERHESTRQLGEHAARHLRRATPERRTSASSAPTRRTRTGSAPSSRSRTAASSSRRSPIDDHVSPDGRVMEVLSEHLCEGWLEGYLLTGRHGLFATYEAFAMVVGVDDRAAHQVARGGARACPGARRSPSLNILLTSTCWRNDHNGFSHQGPGLIDVDALQAGHGRAHLPAARRQLPAVGRRPLPAQPRLREPDRDRQAAAAAVPRHGRGASSTARAAPRSGSGPSNDDGGEPDVVLGAAPATSPTLETRRGRVAAAPARARPARARRQRGRPDDAVPARRTTRTA